MVESGFPCVNLHRYFVPPGNDTPLPTKLGISLRFEEWDNLLDFAEEAKASTKVLREANVCAKGPNHVYYIYI